MTPQPYSNKKQRQISDRNRLNIIEFITNEVHTINETPERFKLPESTVRSIYKTFERTGRVTQLPRGGNRHPRLEQEHLNWIKNRLLQEPSLSISDLHAELNKKFSFRPPVSRNTVRDAVDKRIAYTLKLVHPELEDYNSNARREQRKL
ncbi:hypothetical protein EC957_005672 [Mortierella hygrophila]|uniref:Transposase n=1 Tax=Mortierella hygrophila TaxID=979708 RepID=A0A9P6K6M3_9FUNG|nr:hypothetical protein EC957_005672 [Mortierella hygrophila]